MTQPFYQLRLLKRLGYGVLVSWMLGNTPSLAAPIATPNQSNVNYRTEVELLHTPLNAARLRNSLVWDAADTNWRKPASDEAIPSVTEAPIVVLHLWATWCQPCRDELSILKDLGPVIEQRYNRKVRFVYIAIDTGSADLEQYLITNKAHTPSSRLYLDSGKGGIADTIRNRLTSGKLSLPTTLLVDHQRIIRQAIVGQVNNRRGELIDSIERLSSINGISTAQK